MSPRKFYRWVSPDNLNGARSPSERDGNLVTSHVVAMFGAAKVTPRPSNENFGSTFFRQGVGTRHHPITEPKTGVRVPWGAPVIPMG